MQPQLLAATKFIAHLVNQQVAHELLENPIDDSVEVRFLFVVFTLFCIIINLIYHMVTHELQHKI